MKNDDYKIDLVITWVDGSDPLWQKERDKYVSNADRRNKSIAGDERYLDDGLLKYQFRGIEKYLPWIHKVFFVTWGHLPKWLNTSNPKLVVVRHEDFIPKEYLPTFNTNPIVLNLHRIPGLSEYFIFANDDMYFINRLKPSDFFRKGLPCDMAVQETIEAFNFQDTFNSILINNICLLNKLINKKESQKKHFLKWINYKYGFKYCFKTMCLFPFSLFSGLYEPHTPAPYLKSTYEKVWNNLGLELDSVCKHKIRSPFDCSEYLFRFYQIACGEFVPFNRDKIGAYTNMNSKVLPDRIMKQSKKMICINYFSKKDYFSVKQSFDFILGDKSSFEK